MYGRITPSTKPYILKSIYQSLTGQQEQLTAEQEVDERFCQWKILILLLISNGFHREKSCHPSCT